MKIVLDGVPLSPAPASAEEGVAQALELVAEQKRVVVRLLIDGCEPPSDELEIAAMIASAVDEVALVSDPARNLIATAIGATVATCEFLRSQCAEAADELLAGRLEQFGVAFSRAIEAWAHLPSATAHVKHLLPIAGISDAVMNPVDRESEALARLLTVARDGIASQDWSRVSDVLAHQIDGPLQRLSLAYAGIGAGLPGS